MSHLFEEEVRLLLSAARDAGLLVRKFFGQSIDVAEKGPLDLVTEADYASENLIRERISLRFPGDAITAEESGSAGDSTRRWYIDPLDGTVNFAHGVPLFAVCIAFANEDGPQAGVVFNPFSGECFTAVKGQGACLNGLPIHASGAGRPEDAHLFINPHGLRRPGDAERLLDVYRRLGLTVQGIVNLGTMSLGLSWIAAGRLDAVAALDVDHFSTPACSVILSEAGVVVTDMQGQPYRPGSTSLLAANPVLHPALLRLLQP